MDAETDIAIPEGENSILGADDPMTVRIAQADHFTVTESDYFTTGDNLRNTTSLMNGLVVDWFIHRPEDPIDHAIISLLRMTENHNSTVPPETYLTPESTAYSIKYGLVPLLNELIAAIKKERPEDVVAFTMSYLRWGKKRFLLRHQPAGYAALLATKT